MSLATRKRRRREFPLIHGWARACAPSVSPQVVQSLREPRFRATGRRRHSGTRSRCALWGVELRENWLERRQWDRKDGIPPEPTTSSSSSRGCRSNEITPATDGRSRRKAAIAGRESGRLNWAESALTAVAPGRTGVRAKAASHCERETAFTARNGPSRFASSTALARNGPSAASPDAHWTWSRRLNSSSSRPPAGPPYAGPRRCARIVR
jgi:hypothetical protein